MKRNLIKRALPGMLLLALSLTIGCCAGTVLGKYEFSADVAKISLTVNPKPEDNVFVVSEDGCIIHTATEAIPETTEPETDSSEPETDSSEQEIAPSKTKSEISGQD